MKNRSLKFKLIFAFMLAGMLPLLIIGGVSTRASIDSLESSAQNRLVAIRNVKGEMINQYFETVKGQVLTFSNNLMVREAMKGFKKSFFNFSKENKFGPIEKVVFKKRLGQFYSEQFGNSYQKQNNQSIDTKSLINQISPEALALQYKYIARNKYPLGEKEKLNYSIDDSYYTKLHGKYHPSFRSFLYEFGYYDIFLVDIESGNIVYSVFKELDYATSLKSGPYKESNLAKAFRQASQLKTSNDFVMVDFENYIPSYSKPASFIASPIFDGGKKIGVAVFQIPLDNVNKVMSTFEGFGKTGETYLVGPDYRLRSNTRNAKEGFSVANSFQDKNFHIEGQSVQLALSGKNGVLKSKNYQGHDVISAYSPLNLLGQKWALMAEASTEEAFEAAKGLKYLLMIIIGVSALFIFFLAYFLTSGISKSLLQVAVKLSDSAQHVSESSQEISETSHSLSEAATEQASSLQETVSSVDEISAMVQKNADAAQSSTNVSEQSTRAANEGKQRIEAMISSINDISESNEEIMLEMKHSNEEMTKIASLIGEIGEKTKVINDIVFQTKLLSFNASVEAARAGEHGKGFAVVAEEVGNLASMSGNAAQEISEMLGSSIKQVNDTVARTKQKVESLIAVGKQNIDTGIKTAKGCEDSLDEILENVNSVNEMVREIAEASAEQSVGIREVTQAFQQLDNVTQQNTSVARQSSNMSTKLNNQAKDLNGAIESLSTLIGAQQLRNSHSEESGDDAMLSQFHEEGTKETYQEENVISFQAPQSEFNVPDASAFESEKKAVGMEQSSSIPSADDPRFEDL